MTVAALAVAESSRSERMWESWLAPHRESVLSSLYCLQGTTSFYEVGCGSGPNLRRVREVFPQMRLGGSEPDQELAQGAQDFLGLPISPDPLPIVPTGWDTVLSCYVMAYVHPLVAFDSLRRLYNGGTRALILLEPMGNTLIWKAAGHLKRVYPAGYTETGRAQHAVSQPEWMHDYRALLGESGWRVTWAWPVLPLADGINACIVAER